VRRADLTAFIDLLVEHGYAQLAFERRAARAGVNKARCTAVGRPIRTPARRRSGDRGRGRHRPGRGLARILHRELYLRVPVTLEDVDAEVVARHAAFVAAATRTGG
jgi:hypothetical protein